MLKAPVYGKTRSRRETVTYAQIQRAATDILKTGARPTLESVRTALSGGSPRTILDGLNRYWADLGKQVAGTPDTLRRLPAAVADLAEGMWIKALTIATDAAQTASTDQDKALSQLKSQLAVRGHTLSQREIELDELIRSRERTLKELEEHLRAALSMLTKRDATIVSLESRLKAAQEESESYRRRWSRRISKVTAPGPRRSPKPSRRSENAIHHVSPRIRNAKTRKNTRPQGR